MCLQLLLRAIQRWYSYLSLDWTEYKEMLSSKCSFGTHQLTIGPSGNRKTPRACFSSNFESKTLLPPFSPSLSCSSSRESAPSGRQILTPLFDRNKINTIPKIKAIVVTFVKYTSSKNLVNWHLMRARPFLKKKICYWHPTKNKKKPCIMKYSLVKNK